MKIETKYNIGDKVWYVYESRIGISGERTYSGEVSVYDDTICSIYIGENEINYDLADSSEVVEEKDIILYEETDKLLQKIKEKMQEIHKREEKENGRKQN